MLTSEHLKFPIAATAISYLFTYSLEGHALRSTMEQLKYPLAKARLRQVQLRWILHRGMVYKAEELTANRHQSFRNRKSVLYTKANQVFSSPTSFTGVCEHTHACVWRPPTLTWHARLHAHAPLPIMENPAPGLARASDGCCPLDSAAWHLLVRNQPRCLSCGGLSRSTPLVLWLSQQRAMRQLMRRDPLRKRGHMGRAHRRQRGRASRCLAAGCTFACRESEASASRRRGFQCQAVASRSAAEAMAAPSGGAREGTLT